MVQVRIKSTYGTVLRPFITKMSHIRQKQSFSDILFSVVIQMRSTCDEMNTT
ncbi:unnamed protein product [Schistosoma mansoni]|uniref:Smp_204990 n=1 Tax=Schistosoma mansoni TaxID=6183 RepID=UPI00022C8288|nr:unnamed protein product [Schistosoma mansoni]|eukprot:XP_018647177.1 unnamed protein product [Schistosoma mansoni]